MWHFYTLVHTHTHTGLMWTSWEVFVATDRQQIWDVYDWRGADA